MVNWRTNRVVYLSALIYTGAAVVAAGAFFVITTVTGQYTWVDRLGGAGWVFLLSLVILMPTVTRWVKRLLGQGPRPPR